jgi:hypothetical protein
VRVRRELFWRRRPTLLLIREATRKVRAEGIGWLLSRLGQEFRTPRTTEGVYLRFLNVWMYGVVLRVLTPLIVRGRRAFRTPRNTLYYFYDLDAALVTYDVVDSLVLAELERRRRGCDSVYVVVVPGRNARFREEASESEEGIDGASRRWRLHHLVIPAFALLPTCSGYSVCRDRRQATLFRLMVGDVYPPSYWPAFPLCLFRMPILEAARRGVPIFPMLRSPDQSLRYVRRWLDGRAGARKVVTITLRDSGHEPGRNSNLIAWVEFARELDPDEWAPVFVLDTDSAMDPAPEAIRDFAVFHEGPWNLALRSALYELAYLNLAIVHGSTELFWYNHRCRYVVFVPRDDTGQTAAAPAVMAAYGFIEGESLPFATPVQKWVWEPDTPEAIRREFAGMCAVIEAAASRERAGDPRDSVVR